MWRAAILLGNLTQKGLNLIPPTACLTRATFLEPKRGSSHTLEARTYKYILVSYLALHWF